MKDLTRLFAVMVVIFVAVAMSACDGEQPLATPTPTPPGEGVLALIPDAAFRAYCQSQMDHWDKDGDNVLSFEEAARVTGIYVSASYDSVGEIVSFEGIEYFTGLIDLSFEYNLVTELDLSKNTALVRLDGHANEMVSLDVSRCPRLTRLSCGYNLLTELDVSNNPELSLLFCNDNNLTELDVSKNTKLTQLLCNTNPTFESAESTRSSTAPVILAGCDGSIEPATLRDVHRPAVTMFDVHNTTMDGGLAEIVGSRAGQARGNRLTELDVSKNTALVGLACYGNRLTRLDVSNNKELIQLNCWGNLLTELDVSNNPALLSLTFWNNPITGIDVSRNIALNNLSCGDTRITRLDLSKNVALAYLGVHCNFEQLGLLTSLDVSHNTRLTDLYCYRNRITSLDLSKNIRLDELGCGANLIEELDVSNNFMLTLLSVEGNLLSGLDIINNRRLDIFYCRENPGDGTSRFCVEAWFDGHSMPSNVTYLESGSWSLGNRTVTVQYLKGEPDDSGNKYYMSTDYSRDGWVTTMQLASEGAGIDIVMMGDAYSDRMIDDGTYRREMEFAMECFFGEEPYKSHRGMFNVYSVEVVSPNELIADDSATALNCYFGEGSLVGGDHEMVKVYALKATSTVERMNRSSMIVVVNDPSWHGTCYMNAPAGGDYGEGMSFAYLSTGGNQSEFRQLLHHEANGHGFPKLGDEYWYDDSEAISNDGRAEYEYYLPFGWWRNVDVTSDRAKVKWARFLTDSRYAGQGLGVFQGGFTYGRGVWRPTDNSIMRYNYGGFNAPSREAIYYRIHKLAHGEEWKYDFEEFVEWDMAHLTRSSTTRDPGEGLLRPMPHTPPVILPHSWRGGR